MLTLTRHALSTLTGTELLALVQESKQLDQNNLDDLEVDGIKWRVFTSNTRGQKNQGRIHLWRWNGSTVVHYHGPVGSRIGRLRTERRPQSQKGQ